MEPGAAGLGWVANIDGLSIRELKSLAQEHGVDVSSCFEKEELKQRIKLAVENARREQFNSQGSPSTNPPDQGDNGEDRQPQPPPSNNEGAEDGIPEHEKLFSQGMARINLGEEFAERVTMFPRDAGTGLAVGLRTYVVGAGAAVGAVVALPGVMSFEMAAENVEDSWKSFVAGLQGFGAGLAFGIASVLIVVPTTLVVGTTQVVSGLFNTPETLLKFFQGMYWDTVEKDWVPVAPYDLGKEEERVGRFDLGSSAPIAGSGGGDRSGGDSESIVLDTLYYDTLNVSPSATPGQIKKAYHKAALASHPDKNPGDAAAHERFQAVSHAYQILSQADTRARYDMKGPDAFDPNKGGPATVSPSLFFTMMFGSHIFEPFVGQLMVTQICSLFDPDTDITSKQLRKLQRAREVQLARLLADRLQAFVECSDDGQAFHSEHEAIAAELADAPFGDAMVVAVGWTYKNLARRYSSESALDVVSSHVAACESGFHNIVMQCSYTKYFGNVVDSMKENRTILHSEATPEEKEEANQQMMSALCETVAHMTLVDVEDTVSSVCARVLTDNSVSAEVRAKRCRGLSIIGEIFERTKSTPHADKDPTGSRNWRAEIAQAISSMQAK